MLKQIAFCIALGSKLLALSLSTPVTLTQLEPQHIPFNIQVVMNEQGDAVVTWANMTSPTEGALESAMRTKEGTWLPPTLISKEKVGMYSQTVIDPEGNVGVLWKPDYESLTLYLAEKKWMEPWSKPEEISFSYKDVKFEKVVIDRDRNLVALGEMPFGKGTAVALAFRDVKTHEIMYNERGQVDFSWRPEVFVDSRGVALAVWHSDRMIPGWFSRTDERAFEGAWHEDHQQWSMPEKIFALPNSDTVSAIKIAVDAQRNAVVLRVVGLGDNTKLQAFSRVNEKWLAPVEIAQVGRYMIDLSISMDEKGNFLAIWSDMKKNTLHSVYKPFAGEWQTSLEVLQEGMARFPALAFDHAGNFVLVWSKTGKEDAEIQGAVFATRDGKWSKPGKISPDGCICMFPTVAFSESGKGILAWAQILNLNDPRPFIQAAEIEVK